MNIVNKLTIQHLRKNKRRTLVTIIGVIVSVAMVTAVATLVVSFMGLMQRQTIAIEGEWHVLYQYVNKDQVAAINQDKETKNVALSQDIGYAQFPESQNDYKPYLFIKAYDEQGFQQFPVSLTEGRLPTSEDEIVLSEHIATNAKAHFQLGDVLHLQVGERVVTQNGERIKLNQSSALSTKNGENTESLENIETKSYTVVGFIQRPEWEPTWAPGYTVLTYLDQQLIDAGELVHASVILKKVNRNLYQHAEQLAERHDITSVQFHRNLLRYYGLTSNDGLQRVLYSLSAIIMSVIVIGSISLIYNAFAISVSERTRHLGMLASVGATKSQKRNSVLFEGAVIALISIPIGILCGLLGISITFSFINSMIQGALGMTETLSVVITPGSILISCAISILTIFLSTYWPARRASSISAIDAIRQTSDVKLTRKTVKTSKIIRMLFGIEAEIGLKNLKRNKRRYRATVFSLVISIILFLSVTFFTESMKKSLELYQEGINYDLSISSQGSNRLDDEVIRSILSLDEVMEYSVVNETQFNSLVDLESIADEIHRWADHDDIWENGKFRYDIRVYALNEDSLLAYANTIGAKYEELDDSEHPSAIIIDTVRYQDAATGQYIETKAIKARVGETLDLIYRDWEKEEDYDLNRVEVAALTDQLPMGAFSGYLGSFHIVVSEQVFNQLIDPIQDIIRVRSNLYIKSSDPMKTQQDIEEMKIGNLNIYNVYQHRQSDEQMMMVMSVFTYGFIALITAISIANILNTISTSISLRKREFAMLKSIGMTPKGFNRMIHYESIFYGIKALLYGLPLSILVMYLIHSALVDGFSFGFILPWFSMLYVIAAVFVIVGTAMLYSSRKVKKENIIDALKQENI